MTRSLRLLRSRSRFRRLACTGAERRSWAGPKPTWRCGVGQGSLPVTGRRSGGALCCHAGALSGGFVSFLRALQEYRIITGRR